jgi:RimJ/RimL family protein N-acetyltransferase
MIARMTLSLQDLDWPVRTRRLVIRPVIDADEEAIWSYRKLEATSMWLHTHHRDRAAGTQAEFGWVLHPDHVGHGYATEAVREIVRVVSTSSACAEWWRAASPPTPPPGS